MRPFTWLSRAALLSCALLSSLALAQGTSTITGTVTDAATGQPVPDVVITATSPALQGESVVVTDEAGLYHLAQLPAGVYTLSLEKETFKPYTRGEITVRVDRTVRVNLQLQPEAVQGDTVVVVGKPPTVDVGSTTTGLSVGKEFINTIAFLQPNGAGVRSFEALAAVAPQVVADDHGYGFSGAQSPENLYLVDGVSTGDPAYGTSGAQFPVEFVAEANVITGGYQAEYGRATGGVLNVVTKSGSNEFHGSVWGNWSPGVLSGTPTRIDSEVSSITTDADGSGRGRLWNTFDFGAEVGGPIVKDKLWFYVGFAPSFSRTRTTRELRALGVTLEDGTEDPVLPGMTQRRFEDSRAFSYLAKLTWLLGADHTLSASVVGSPSQLEVPYAFSPARRTASWSGGSVLKDDTTTVSLKYQGSLFDKHLLLDASLGWFHLEKSDLPNDGSAIGAPPGDGSGAGTPVVIYRRTAPHFIGLFEPLTPEAAALCADDPATCPATGGSEYATGGAGYMEQATMDRLQGRVSLTGLFQALGHHRVKAGLDVEHLRYDITKAYSGGTMLRESSSGNTYADYRQFGYLTGPDEAVRQLSLHSTPTALGVGAYLQDSWSLMDVVTLNLGLRYENQQLFAGDGTLGISLNNMLAPRVGVIYDFTQQGRSKLYANYSRFYEAVPLAIADRALTGENGYQFTRRRRPNDLGNDGPGCQPLLDVNQVLNECQDPRNIMPLTHDDDDVYYYDVSPGAVITGGGKTLVDPTLQPQSSDEIVVGGEYEVITDGRLGVTYTRRYLNQVIEDMSVDEGSTYFIGNPGAGLGQAFPRATRDYDAVTAAFTKAFSDGWMAQVSYTWSYLRGNYNGLYRPETAQLDPNMNADFDLVSLLDNRDGRLNGDHTHFVKAYASKEFQLTGALGLLVGLSYEGRSGAPINYYGGYQWYGPDETFVLPRGAGGELPWRHAVNFKGGVTWRVSKENAVQLTADVFNLFNFQAITGVDQTFTASDVVPFRTNEADPVAAACVTGADQPHCQLTNEDGERVLPIQQADGTLLPESAVNANFKRPTSYQAPISVRFGLRFTF